MNIWHLPGPSTFLGAVERSLRDGQSVILRFPDGMPTGFDTALHLLLRDCWRWHIVDASTVVESESNGALRELCRQFAPDLSNISGVSAFDLCETDAFLGRLIWISGLHSANWPTWRTFLTTYAQASRSVPTIRRTLFVTPIHGQPLAEFQGDVALAVHDWRGVVDEMDLLFLANQRLRSRDIDGKTRVLLATTVARLSAWDTSIAERLCEENEEVILSPLEMLKSVAGEKGWTHETPAEWRLGTDSGSGSLHAALAAVRDPREVQHRLLSAQLSVLLPVIELLHRKIVQEYYFLIDEHLQQNGQELDPYDLQIGDFVGLFKRPGFDRTTFKRVLNLRNVRNALAHRQPLSPLTALSLIRS